MFDPSKSLKKMLGKGLQVPRMMTGTKSPSDWDGDGILNKFDCQPRNLIRQDPISERNKLAIKAARENKLNINDVNDIVKVFEIAHPNNFNLDDYKKLAFRMKMNTEWKHANIEEKKALLKANPDKYNDRASEVEHKVYERKRPKTWDDYLEII